MWFWVWACYNRIIIDMTSDIHKKVCEICGQKANAGILDNEDTNHNDRDIQIRIRYSCLDH